MSFADRTFGEERVSLLRLLAGAAAEATGLLDLAGVMTRLAFQSFVVTSPATSDAIDRDFAVGSAIATSTRLKPFDVEVDSAGLCKPTDQDE